MSLAGSKCQTEEQRARQARTVDSPSQSRQTRQASGQRREQIVADSEPVTRRVSTASHRQRRRAKKLKHTPFQRRHLRNALRQHRELVVVAPQPVQD